MAARNRELVELYSLPTHGQSSDVSAGSPITVVGNEATSKIYRETTYRTSRKLQEAAKYLSELVGSYDPDTLYHACLKLAEVIKGADAIVLQLLLERDVVGVIVRMMEALPSHSSAQQAGCDALLSCNKQIELRSSVEDHNVYHCVLDAMKKHGEDPYLAGKAVDTLASLSSTALSDAGLKESRAYSFVLAALRTHHYDISVQSSGLLALANMLKTDTYAVSSMALQGDHKVITDSIKHHSSNPTVVAHGFQTLQAIANSEIGMRTCMLSEATDILTLVVEQLKKHSDNEGVVTAGCGLLDALTEAEADADFDDILTASSTHQSSEAVSIASSTTSSSTQVAFVQHVGHVKLLELLTFILKRYTGILDIQRRALSSLEHLCALPAFEAKVQDSMLEEWLYLLNDAFTNHGQELAMQEAGCRCLARLLEIRPYFIEMIGDDKERYQVPLHTRVWESVLSLLIISRSGDPKPSLFKAVTWALYYLVETDESLQKALVDKGVTVAVFEALREYISEMTRNEQCVEYGCRALRGILMHPCKDDDKNYLISIGMVGDLKTIVDGFMYNADLIAEAFSVIACLSDMENFQKAVIDCSLHKPVLEAVERHSTHEILVESALEILIILTQNKLLQPVLNEADALGATVSIMKTHVVSPSIQCKGCMLIRFLSCPNYLTSKPLCTAIAKVVIAALSKRSDIRLQMESVHCAQTLCVMSNQMAEAFVRNDIHLILFNILYRDRDDKTDFTLSVSTPSSAAITPFRDITDSMPMFGARRLSFGDDVENSEAIEQRDFVFQVGTDIIYTLSFVWDFKQAMMTTAIKDGLTEGVNVLIDLGADVNAGEESEVPICLAIQSGNKEMVELVLNKGAANIQKALDLAREKRQDEIIGLLLAHIALEKSSEIVNLSGLELDRIKPTWILPSLGMYYSPPKRRFSGHRRNRSLGQMKELIMLRRRSVDVLPMTMFAGTEGASGGGAATGKAEWDTGGISSGMDEPESGVHSGTTNNIPLVPLRGGMGIRNENITPPSRKARLRHRHHSEMEILPSKVIKQAPQRQGLPNSQSSPILSKHPLTVSSEKQSNSGNTTPPNKPESDSENQANEKPNILMESITPPQAPPPLIRERKQGTAHLSLPVFEPTLSPIHGTPSHSLHRRRVSVEETDSGVPLSPDDPDKQIMQQSYSAESLNSTATAENNVSLTLNTTPRSRRYRERKGTVTGARVLPFINPNEYLNRHKQQQQQNLETRTESDISTPAQSPPEDRTLRREFPMSPTQLFNRLRKHRRKRRERKPSSIFYTPRSSSPIAIVYPRMEFDGSSAGDSSEFSFSKNSNRESKSADELENSTMDDDAFTTPKSQKSSSKIITSAASLSAVSQKLQKLRPTKRRQATERTPSSSSSSVLTTPSTSATSSRRASVDNVFLSHLNYRQSRDEVDFGAYEAIPEESVTSEVSIMNPKLVRMVDLSSNILTTLVDLAESPGHQFVAQQMAEVCKLDLKQNQLDSLPRILMKELKMLTHLNLSCNHFTMFPLEAVLSQKLVSLDLSANKISRVPIFSPLPNLIRLNLSSNQLETFPPTLGRDERTPLLPHLKYLDLRSNQIRGVPDHNVCLKDLEELNISKNQIKDLPVQFLASFLSLKTLDASRNELECIAGDVGQDLVELQVLKVANNRLGEHEAELNNFITSAPVIQTVDTSENGLLSLPPPYAWKSRGVREIKMTGNKVSKLDFSDCGRFWPKLESLYLGQNKLKEIPKEIGLLHSLSCFDVSHNKELRHLPYEMGNLEYLFMLNLQGLRNLSIDQSLLSGSTKAIVSYLKSRLTRSVPYYHMKMMIVGAADKGKTTLLRQILQEKAPTSLKTNVATMGVTVKQWSYLQKQSSGHSDKYHVSCWDFAGQEEFYTTHQCFLSQRSLYVVVYNLSLGESELQMLLPWLLNINARAPSSPVLVVGTHADKLSDDEFKSRCPLMRDKIKEMLRRPGFPLDVSFAEVSCFDEKQMVDLRKKIKTLIDNAKLRGQKIMGGLVPSNYLALEELIKREKLRLERNKSKFPVIHASRLKQLMDESGLSSKMDKAQTEQAINFLHECGVLLHYNDVQTKLSDLYFLDPEWLCMLMGQIITIKQVNAFTKDGLIKMGSIPHLLKEPRFPSEFIPEYIRLLERFEVALKQTQDLLLIPSQLPKKIPSGITVPNVSSGGQIIRRYELCYIPPGFWPRLIARLILFPVRTLFNGQDTKPKVRHLWSGGIYSFWSNQSYFLVELLTTHPNTFDITVPTTNSGTRLLCSIVDNVEALIDEWFPGLRDICVINGTQLVTPLSLCPFCNTKPPHCFALRDLIRDALTTDKVHCPKHNGFVDLEILAPDTVVSDLDPEYKVVPGEFTLDESTKNIIGKGGFGEVYKATFRNQTVAVKVFTQKVASINNTTPNHLIRQEVQILSQLQHPFIISLVAVCMRPKAMLLLEYAELGSLSSFDPYSNLNLPLKHRIAVQVASALAFLHMNKVIYRDLKPGNVLIFSLSLLSKVNAKLSDYGIACYATESGLTQPMGTAGCKAPELLAANTSYMPYNDKVDIYSFGLLLFVMMTNGHRPFEELAAGFEIDKFIMEGRPINDIEHYGCPPWPDMQDLINHCLQYNPNDRPTAQQVFDRLCTTEFVSLKRTIQVECDQDTESLFTTRFSRQDGVKHIEVWIVSAVGSQGLLSIMNLSQLNATPQGTALEEGVMILSMIAMDSTYVLMGTNTGTVMVFDGYTHKLKHKLFSLHSPVLCLLYIKTREGSAYICAGLANGKMAIYNHYSIGSPNMQPDKMVDIGTGPVKGMKRYHSRLFICCGTEVVVMEVTKDMVVTRRWKALDNFSSSYLTYIDVGHDSVWTACSKSSAVHIWDIDDGTLKGTLRCDEFVNDLLQLPKEKRVTPLQARVTSLLLQQQPSSTLWLGLGSGHLLLVNATTRIPLMAVRRQVSAVRGLLSVRALVGEKPAHLILSGGFGFQQRPTCTSSQANGEPHRNSSDLLVWDSIMPKMKKTYDNIRKQLEPYMNKEVTKF